MYAYKYVCMYVCVYVCMYVCMYSGMRICLYGREFNYIFAFRSHYGPGVDSASNRNEYQEYFLGGKGGRCLGLTTLLPSCADCLEIWELQPPGTLRAYPGL
jgi:hypothetical protein